MDAVPQIDLAPPYSRGTGAAGALLIEAALAAATSSDVTAAGELTERAARLADDANCHDHDGIAFGATPVDLARALIATWSGDHHLAVLRHRRAIGANGWHLLPAEHRAAHLIDIARAHLNLGDAGAAGQALVNADRIAPAETWTRRVARESLAAALRAGPTAADVARLVAAIGLTRRFRRRPFRRRGRRPLVLRLRRRTDGPAGLARLGRIGRAVRRVRGSPFLGVTLVFGSASESYSYLCDIPLTPYAARILCAVPRAVTVAWEVMPPISECLNSGVDGVACGAAQGIAGPVFAFPAALLVALLGAKLLRVRQWWQVSASATFLTALLTTVTHIDTWRALAALPSNPTALHCTGGNLERTRDVILARRC
ncbi:hypothetical protein [Micromonospora sp. NPDC049102]|uniref:hypothetical protein n=1 Tax=Micromonospora sp. NPDC049102 TaxID=3364265 RepID=UPI0037175FF1